MADPASRSGTLYVVGTPLGNLADLSPRAREVLATAELIAAEDTRHTRGLLSRIGVESRLIAYHEHNEAERVPDLLQQLAGGKSVALVSDAGTPLISDPGWRLVNAAQTQHIAVIPVPGPCAAVAALSAAGLPTDHFVFEGFLPRREAARAERLAHLRHEPRTMVFYEAVHRVPETIAAMRAAFGDDRPAVLARELTKLFETVLDGDLAALHARVLADADQRKGEFVLVVQGVGEDADAKLAEGRRVHAILARQLSPSTAAKLAA